jgi:hypothetical protein
LRLDAIVGLPTRLMVFTTLVALLAGVSGDELYEFIADETRVSNSPADGMCFSVFRQEVEVSELG